MKVTMIGYIGKMGSGKNTVVDLLRKQLSSNNFVIAFSDFLKADLKKIGVDTIKKSNYLRVLMQAYGSYKRSEDKNYWIKKHNEAVMDHICFLKNIDNIFIQIPDVRFHNEIEYIKNNNGIFVEILCDEKTRLKRLLNRSNESIGFNHESENELHNHNYKTIKIDNSFDLNYTNSQVCKKLNLGVLHKYGTSNLYWYHK